MVRSTNDGSAGKMVNIRRLFGDGSEPTQAQEGQSERRRSSCLNISARKTQFKLGTNPRNLRKKSQTSEKAVILLLDVLTKRTRTKRPLSSPDSLYVEMSQAGPSMGSSSLTLHSMLLEVVPFRPRIPWLDGCMGPYLRRVFQRYQPLTHLVSH